MDYETNIYIDTTTSKGIIKIPDYMTGEKKAI